MATVTLPPEIFCGRAFGRPPVSIRIQRSNWDSDAEWRCVKLLDAYCPAAVSDYPVRGASYSAGEVCAFPEPEAAALVAAAVAEYYGGKKT